MSDEAGNAPTFQYTPAQKKSLYRWAMVCYLASLFFPVIHQILFEEIDWVPGSFGRALFIGLKFSVPFLLLHGVFLQMQRAMGIAEGTWGKKKEDVSAT